MTDRRATSQLLNRLRDERGMSLIELLTALVVGGFVITAAIMLVMMSMRASARVSDRVNAAAVGRSGMELITQRVRSQACIFPGEYSVNGTENNADGQNSILFAGPTEIAFLADISNAGGSTAFAGSVGYVPRIHYILVTPRGNGQRGSRIVATTRAPNTSSAPFDYSVAGSGVTTFTSLATTSGIQGSTPTDFVSLADGVTQLTTTAGAAQPYFQYYDEDNLGPTGVPLAITNGALSLTSLSDISKVTVAFTVLGESGIDQAVTPVAGATAIDNRTATFQSDISMRTEPDACG